MKKKTKKYVFIVLAGLVVVSLLPLLMQGADPWVKLENLPSGFYMRLRLAGDSVMTTIVNDPDPEYLLTALKYLEPDKGCEVFELFVSSAPGVCRNQRLTGEEARRVDLAKLEAMERVFPNLSENPQADVFLAKALQGNRFPCVLALLRKGFPVNHNFLDSIMQDRKNYANTDNWPPEAREGLVKPDELCAYLESIDPDIFSKCVKILEERDRVCHSGTSDTEHAEARQKCVDSLKSLAEELNAKRSG